MHLDHQICAGCNWLTRLADAVLTSGHCCLSATPDLVTHGINVTIGYDYVSDVYTSIASVGSPGTINEFVDSTHLITPPWFSTHNWRRYEAWDICLIKLAHEYSLPPAHVNPIIGKAS